MTTNESGTGLERELSQSIEQLQTALQQASTAIASIQTMLPRIGAISTMFAELDEVFRAGREQIGGEGAVGTMAYSRPTLVVPSATATSPEPAGNMTPQPLDAGATRSTVAETDTTEAPALEPGSAAGLISFRLEFESRPGPLDLRTVDDAVSEHPSVRDVALLDYDGRKATLKVWIESSASPADVQNALLERSSQIFAPGNDVTIVAIEDAA